MTWRNAEKLDKLDMLIGLALENFKDDDAEKYIGADLSDVTFSDSYHRRKKRVINRYLAKQVFASARKVAARVAIVVLCLISAAFITVMSVSALRNSLWKAIIEWYDDYFVLRYEQIEITEDSLSSDNDINNSVPTKIEEFKKPQYLPEGVEEEILMQNKVMHIIDYYIGDELQYTFKQQVLDSRNEIINNENSVISEIMINQRLGLLFESLQSEELIIVWDDGKYTYLISSYLDIDETIKIAESVAPETDEKDSGMTSGVPTKILEYRKPTYLPKGFEEQETVKGKGAYCIEYYQNGIWVCVYRQRVLNEDEKKINNENSIVYQVDIKGNEATVIENKDDKHLTVIWEDGRYIYWFSSYISLEETIKMAESIETVTENTDNNSTAPVEIIKNIS